MTRDELIALALTELDNLSSAEREIIYEHLESRIHDELARKIAEEAAQLWEPADQSGVAPKDWVREYLNVTLDLFHDQRMAFEMEKLRAEAAVFVDNLGSELRALVCCVLGTTQRKRVVSILAKLVYDAIAAELVSGADRRAAVKKTLEAHLAAHLDDVEATYFAEQRRAGSN